MIIFFICDKKTSKQTHFLLQMRNKENCDSFWNNFKNMYHLKTGQTRYFARSIFSLTIPQRSYLKIDLCPNIKISKNHSHHENILI